MKKRKKKREQGLQRARLGVCICITYTAKKNIYKPNALLSPFEGVGVLGFPCRISWSAWIPLSDVLSCAL